MIFFFLFLSYLQLHSFTKLSTTMDSQEATPMRVDDIGRTAEEGRETAADRHEEADEEMEITRQIGHVSQPSCMIVKERLQLDGIRSFTLGADPAEDLDEWVMDFERKLSDRGAQKSQYIKALKQKIPGLESRLCTPAQGFAVHYEDYRDEMLRQLGAPDPWFMMIKRLSEYAPSQLKVSQVVMELERLQSLWLRIIERLYAGKNEVRNVLKSDVVPRQVLLTLQKGFTSEQRRHTAMLFRNGALPSLQEVRSLLMQADLNSVMNFTVAAPHVPVHADRTALELTEMTRPSLPVALLQERPRPEKRPQQQQQQQQQPRQQQQQQQAKQPKNKKAKVYCNFCNKPNHVQDDCWRKYPDKKPAPRETKKAKAQEQAQPTAASQIASIRAGQEAYTAPVDELMLTGAVTQAKAIAALPDAEEYARRLRAGLRLPTRNKRKQEEERPDSGLRWANLERWGWASQPVNIEGETQPSQHSQLSQKCSYTRRQARISLFEMQTSRRSSRITLPKLFQRLEASQGKEPWRWVGMSPIRYSRISCRWTEPLQLSSYFLSIANKLADAPACYSEPAHFETQTSYSTGVYGAIIGVVTESEKVESRGDVRDRRESQPSKRDQSTPLVNPKRKRRRKQPQPTSQPAPTTSQPHTIPSDIVQAARDADQKLRDQMTMPTTNPSLPEDPEQPIVVALTGTSKRFVPLKSGPAAAAKAFVLIGKRTTPTLFDSGATPAAVHVEVWKELKAATPELPWRPTPQEIVLSTANGTPLLTEGITVLPVTLVGRVYFIEVYIATHLPYDLLLGLPAMFDIGVIIDAQDLRLRFKSDPHRSLKIQLEGAPPREVYAVAQETRLPPFSQSVIPVEAQAMGIHTIMPLEGRRWIQPYAPTERYKRLLVAPGICDQRAKQILVANLTASEVRLVKGTQIATAEAPSEVAVVTTLDSRPSGLYDELDEMQPQRSVVHRPMAPLEQIWEELHLDRNEKNLTPTQLQKLRDLLQKYQHLWSVEGMPLTQTQSAEHRIDTGKARSLAQKPRPTGLKQKEEIQRQVEEMLRDGIINPSTSPWASPIVLVKKKDGSTRFCVDYRKLNEVTVRDHYPLPRTEDILDTLDGAMIFSTLDLRSGYWQVPVAPADKPKTAFVTYGGLYEYNVMPFGLTNAPATFQRLMDAVLAGLRWQTCLVYLDDIIVFAPDFDTHIQRLDEVFKRLAASNLSLKPSKCELFREEVAYLGHVVSADGIKPQADKIDKIQRFPVPTTRKAVRSFLGLAGYYRRYIRNFARLAKPLHKLTGDNTPWQWGEAEQQSFEALKAALATAPILHFPNPNWQMVLDTDASADGFGAILMQIDSEGRERVLAYASRLTFDNEKKWSASELEAGAIIWALEKFRPYVIDVPLKCRTDHASLKWIRQSSTGRLVRWALKLDEYDITLEPRPGVKMPHVDALSRYPVHVITLDTLVMAPIIAPLAVEDADTVPQASYEARYIRGDQPSAIQWLQKQDAECQQIHKALTYGTVVPPHLKQYITAGQLKIVDHTIQFQERLRDVLYVPVTLREKLLNEYHAGSCAAHLGSKKTLGALKRKYFWPSMKNDVFEYVHGCLACLQRKGRRVPTGPRASLPKGKPFHIVASDIFGPLPPTTRGNRFILLFIDHFTKWPVIIPAKQITAATFVQLFHDTWISTYGCPARLLTDGGPQFIADTTAEFCSKYGIQRTIATAYHPQSNGIAEGFMKVIGHSLSILTQYKATNWDLHCTTIALAYRTTPHPATGNTPAYLTFGFDPKLPVDRELLTTSDSAETDERLQNLAMWREQARSRLIVNFDPETAPQAGTIQTGMLVAYRYQQAEVRDPVTHKLQARYSPPWRVVRQLDNGVTYEIRHPVRGETKLINRDRLVPFKPRQGYVVQTDTQSLPHYFAPSSTLTNDSQHTPSTSLPPTTPPPVSAAPAAPRTPAARHLRATVERRSRVGDPMSWQYGTSGTSRL